MFERFLNDEFGTECVALGDSAYPYERFICKPLSIARAANEKNYQNCQIRARNVVERVNGQLKREFPVLGFRMTFRKKETAQDIVVCCAILHNMRKFAKPSQRAPNTAAEIFAQERAAHNMEVFEIEQGSNRFRIQEYLVNEFFNTQ